MQEQQQQQQPLEEDDGSKPLHLFKAELASVLENNATKLRCSRDHKPDVGIDPKSFQRKSSQSSLVKLFASRSPSISTLHSSKSESVTIKKTGSRTALQTKNYNDNNNSSNGNSTHISNEVQVKRKDYARPRSNFSSDTEDADIHYSKLQTKRKSRFLVALQGSAKHRDQTIAEPNSIEVTLTPEPPESAAARSKDFVRNVKEFGSQLRTSFFKRKVVQLTEKVGPLKQIHSDDDSSDTEPEDVIVFMPVPSKSSDSEQVERENSIPSEASLASRQSSEQQPKIDSKQYRKDFSNPRVEASNSVANTAQSREAKQHVKAFKEKETKQKAKSKSSFYTDSESIRNSIEQNPSVHENGLRQYFEQALSNVDSAKTKKRRNFFWSRRKREPEVAVATKCSIDIGTQFPEVDLDEVAPQNSLCLEKATAIPQEMLWNVPRNAPADQENSEDGMTFRCSSGHNDFPIHEPDYVPGDSELTLSSLAVSEKVNTIHPPTYYGLNPKRARIPIFSSCCPAKANDLSVPYVKPVKESTESKLRKNAKETESAERNPAMAFLKTVTKQVVVKLRERDKWKKSVRTLHPVSQLTERKWHSCEECKKESSVDDLAVLSKRRKSI